MLNSLWRKEFAVMIIGLFIAMSFNLPVRGHIDDKNTIEFVDNHPPDIPTVEYFSIIYVGEKCDFKLYTNDPDGDDVYYFIEWGDGSDSGWVGPYKSGVYIKKNHIYENSGTYYIRIKAKDVYGAESLESINFSIYVSVHVDIRVHRGFGVGVTVTVRNLGVKDFENINWSFSFYRQTRTIPWPIITIKQGILKSLKAGERKTIRSGFMINFVLKSYIAFDMYDPIRWGNGYTRCKIIGPFVYIPLIQRSP
jgi:hypothetical protein